MELTLKQRAALEFAKLMLGDALACRRAGAIGIDGDSIKEYYPVAWKMAEHFVQAEPVEIVKCYRCDSIIREGDQQTEIPTPYGFGILCANCAQGPSTHIKR